MKEHNTNFYSLENIKETLKSCEDFLDGEEVYYHIGALRFAYDEIERLNNIIDELGKRLENVFNEMKEKIVEIKGRGYYYTDLIPIEVVLNDLKKLKEGKI